MTDTSKPTPATSTDEAYHPDAVEAKWQARWAERGTNEPDLDRAARPFYNLMMFPYPLKGLQDLAANLPHRARVSPVGWPAARPVHLGGPPVSP